MTQVLTPLSTQEIFDRISKNGINVNLEGLHRKTRELQASELQSLNELDLLTDFASLRQRQPGAFVFKKGDPARFNPRSSKHINAWLVDRGEEPTHSVSEQSLERRLPHDLWEKIMESRRYRKFWGDLGKLKNYTGLDGKIHVNWTEAVTGRWYTGNPPIQTMAKICREFMVPDEGNVFYVIDWNSQELYFLAHLSGEPFLKGMLDRGEDPHMGAYCRVTGKDPSEDFDTFNLQRTIGKMLNYGLIYGIEAEGLGARLKIPNDRAQSLIDAYFAAMPILSAWRDDQYQEVMVTGLVTTMAGREIPIDVSAVKRAPEDKRKRMAVNYKVQGSAADQLVDLLHRTSSDLDLLDRIRATIHDALLVEVPTSGVGHLSVTQFAKLMHEPFMEMQIPVEIKGPAKTWREAMDFKGGDDG